MAMAMAKEVCLGGGGNPSSASSSPKSSTNTVVGNFSLEEIPAKWDDLPAIRDRMRNGESLIMRFDSTVGKTEAASAVEATVENLKLNTPVLLPIMEIMAINDLRLPSIEALIGAIEDFYQLCKKTVRQPDYVYQAAWSIRRMIGRAKKFIYRPHPPQDWPSKKQVKVKVSKGHNLNPIQLYLYSYISYHNATSHPHVF